MRRLVAAELHRIEGEVAGELLAAAKPAPQPQPATLESERQANEAAMP